MAVTNYHTVNGRILGETTSGARTDYLPDALGSVRMTTNGSSIKNTYRYDAYGGQQIKTGPDPDPSFGWVGTFGYRRTTMPYADHYVRARHYGGDEGRWTSVDPLWPMERAYIYVADNPVTVNDVYGLQHMDKNPFAEYCQGWNRLLEDVLTPKQTWKPGAPVVTKRDSAGRIVLPAGQSYLAHCCEAMDHPFWLFPRDSLTWFNSAVKTGGKWDFKFGGRRQWASAGNFHYGFVAACAGIPLELALKGAGYQQWSGGNPNEWFGCPWGVEPYGDDPDDQVLIKDGYRNAIRWMEELRRKCDRLKRKKTLAGSYEDFKSWRDREIDRMFKEGGEIGGYCRWWDR